MRKLLILFALLIPCISFAADRPKIDTVWERVTFMGSNATEDKIYNHNALSWNGKLWIFSGTGAGGQHYVTVKSFEESTHVVTEEYDSAIGLASPTPAIWRTGVVFNNNLYLGFLGLSSGPVNRGGVWKWNSTGSATQVMDTRNFSTPAAGAGQIGVTSLAVCMNKIWAGAGTDSGGEGTLYSSPDGTTWTLEHVFTGYSFVRGLACWNDELWIGTRQNASVWHTDGTTYTQVTSFPTSGTDNCQYQAKELIPYGNKLYIGCVNNGTGSFNAKVYSTSDGSTFTTEITMPADHEIYHGDVCGGHLYFAVRTDDSPTGGAVIGYDGNSWRTVFRDTGINFSHVMFAKCHEGYLYVGGSNKANQPVYLYRALTERSKI